MHRFLMQSIQDHLPQQLTTRNGWRTGIKQVVNKCKHLKYKFTGVYSADTVPVTLGQSTSVDTFQN